MEKKYFIIRTYLGNYEVEEVYDSKKVAKARARALNKYIANINEDLEVPHYFVTKRLEEKTNA